METQFLFIILFFTGISPIISSVPRRYYFISSGKTWSDARAYCRANHDDLAIIDSAANLLRLQKEAQGTLNNLNIFIGMYLNPNSFLWSYRNESLGSFTNWATGCPNNVGGKLGCVLLTQSGWYTVVCTLLRAFICYDDRRTGADRYIYYSTVKTWSEAQSFCRQDHTDLASARTATEHSDIMGKVPGDTWFGLFREPWKWLDQTDVALPWFPNLPDNYNGAEYFGYMFNFLAADTLSSIVLPFLFHRVVTGQQQILRFKVESNQDVNDPTIKAALLEMIQQKLKDHGIELNIELNTESLFLRDSGFESQALLLAKDSINSINSVHNL